MNARGEFTLHLVGKSGARHRILDQHPAGRQPRTVATASKMVSASTASTSEPRNAAETAGTAAVQTIADPYPKRSCVDDVAWLSMVMLAFRARRALSARINHPDEAHHPFVLMDLVLLCHKFWCPFRVAQHGQRESVVARAATNLRRIVAIEFGTWRSGRNGGSSGLVTFA